MSVLDEIAILVRDANPGRQATNIQRRTLKLIEELGEVAQAWLHVTSQSNGKGKTWNDVREEAADCLIVALDIGWTRLSGESSSVTAPEFSVASGVFDPQMIIGISLGVGLFGIHSEIAVSEMYVCQARHDITGVINGAACLTLAILPDQINKTITEIETQLLVEVKRKLAKWADNRATMTVVTDGVPDYPVDNHAAEIPN
jgi:hypothetical protein